MSRPTQEEDYARYFTALKKQQERVEWVVEGLDDDRLTVWEAGFMESVQKQSENGRFLSDRQMEIIERIYKEKAQ